MPYINSTLTVKLTEDKKESLKSELGKIITQIPGKSEEWLMVGFTDNYTLYFKGERKQKAAFIEVKIAGTASRDDKNRVTASICTLLQNELDIPQDSVYITFSEVADWGWNGELF